MLSNEMILSLEWAVISKFYDSLSQIPDRMLNGESVGPFVSMTIVVSLNTYILLCRKEQFRKYRDPQRG